MFARGTDGTILERHLSASAWTAWASLGGSTTSGPAAAALNGAIYVFARGPDGSVHQNALGTSGWTGWRSLGGYTTSAPAATQRRGRNYIDLAVRGVGDQLFVRTFTAAAGWGDWTPHGGSLTSAPAINSPDEGDFNVWARSAGGALQVISFKTGSGWSGWKDFGGALTGAPTAVSRAAGIQNVYMRGAANAVYRRGYTTAGGSWTPWAVADPRPVSSSPAAAGDGANHEWIVARGGGGVLFKEWRSGQEWTAWSDLGAPAVPAPPAATPVPTPAPAPAPPPPGPVDIQAATGCTLHGDRLRVRISVKQVRGRMVRVVFFTKGRGRTVRVDRRAPFDVRLRINRPAGSRGRVYARLYYRLHGELRRKTVSGRYSVCP